MGLESFPRIKYFCVKKPRHPFSSLLKKSAGESNFAGFGLGANLLESERRVVMLPTGRELRTERGWGGKARASAASVPAPASFRCSSSCGGNGGVRLLRASVLRSCRRRAGLRHAAGEGVTGHLPLERVAAHEVAARERLFPTTGRSSGIQRRGSFSTEFSNQMWDQCFSLLRRSAWEGIL